ncbi:MAG TPA: hypothetical protein VE709_14415 [Pseudonocardiaceae bacterium]|nr:hypothetical protein [Pseudonocardiaceae bacterium]
MDGWGEADKTTWYATNIREGVRDETVPAWRRNGALIVDESVPATSSHGRYSLASDFAALLDPNLTGDDLEQNVRDWQDRHLTMTARLRAQRARDAARAGHAIVVLLPGGVARNLLPGQSRVILKGVIEEWTKLLDDPVVVFISQSGEKVNVSMTSSWRPWASASTSSVSCPTASLLTSPARSRSGWSRLLPQTVPSPKSDARR